MSRTYNFELFQQVLEEALRPASEATPEQIMSGTDGVRNNLDVEPVLAFLEGGVPALKKAIQDGTKKSGKKKLSATDRRLIRIAQGTVDEAIMDGLRALKEAQDHVSATADKLEDAGYAPEEQMVCLSYTAEGSSSGSDGEGEGASGSSYSAFQDAAWSVSGE